MSEREHIKMGAGYIYATKGEGSTVRIHSPREAYVGALPPHIPILPVMYHPFFEQMAREIGAENAALKAENKRLRNITVGQRLTLPPKPIAAFEMLPKDQAR